MRDRAYGVPRTKGPLVVLDACEPCAGIGMVATGDDFDPYVRCQACHGRGGIPKTSIPRAAARKQAAATVRNTQGHGQVGKNM